MDQVDPGINEKSGFPEPWYPTNFDKVLLFLLAMPFDASTMRMIGKSAFCPNLSSILSGNMDHFAVHTPVE